MNIPMEKGPKVLEEREDNWVTDMGAWFAGERVVFRGKDLFTELFDKSWVDIWFYGITGKFFTKEQIELFSRTWVICTSYPEPRIWNNRVAALSGTARTTAMMAVSCAIAVSEGKFYGGQANFAAVEFIKKAKKLVEQGEDLEDIVKAEIKATRQVPVGFGRPIINKDERVPHALRLAKELGFDDGPHLNLAYRIEEILRKTRYRAVLNIGGFTSALYADQGLEAKDFYRMATVIYSAGMMACYIDAVDKPAGTFFPLRCERIAYEGIPLRKWEN